VADRNQDRMAEQRKRHGKWVLENGWQLPRIEVAGDICLRTRSNQGCRADDDDL